MSQLSGEPENSNSPEDVSWHRQSTSCGSVHKQVMLTSRHSGVPFLGMLTYKQPLLPSVGSVWK